MHPAVGPASLRRRKGTTNNMEGERVIPLVCPTWPEGTGERVGGEATKNS